MSTIPWNTSLEDDVISSAWARGNNGGAGFPIGDEEEDTTPMVAAQQAGLRNPRWVDGRDGGIVVGWQDKRLIAIAFSNGPWAVDVTEDCAEYYRHQYGADA